MEIIVPLIYIQIEQKKKVKKPEETTKTKTEESIADPVEKSVLKMLQEVLSKIMEFKQRQLPQVY